MNLVFKPLSKDNLEEGLSLGRKIFPDDFETLELGYRASLNLVDPRWKTRKILDYFLVYDDKNKLVAITGFYQWTKHSEDEVWLGWYGVDSEERGRGIGRQVLNWTIKSAKERGYKKFRLWTTACPAEAVAQKLYEDVGLKIYSTEKKPEEEYEIMYREINL